MWSSKARLKREDGKVVVSQEPIGSDGHVGNRGQKSKAREIWFCKMAQAWPRQSAVRVAWLNLPRVLAAGKGRSGGRRRVEEGGGRSTCQAD
jgi:hypothetical protein